MNGGGQDPALGARLAGRLRAVAGGLLLFANLATRLPYG